MSRGKPEPSFAAARAPVEALLSGSIRRELVAELARAKDQREALLRLREAMRTNSWKLGAAHVHLDRIVRAYDGRARLQGFHVLHDWDGKADRVNEDIIPVDVLDYLVRAGEAGPPDRTVLAILLDYYLLHVLALFSLRIWDDGDADENLARIDRLLGELQGPEGSGQQFVADAETLILIATSHYERDEHGYDELLASVRALARGRQTRIALGHASSMGSHLRFGFEATYARDTTSMRTDNVADYPWLCFAVTTVLKEYARLREAGASVELREPVVEALLNGLTPDLRAFIDEAPGVLASAERERSEFRDLFHAYRQELQQEFERYRPTPQAYSPISFFFNFAHNVLKGTVVDSLLWSDARPLAFNDLLTALPRDEARSKAKATLATTLMGYARTNPDRIRGKLMPVIVYDPTTGHQAFARALRLMANDCVLRLNSPS